MDAKMRDEILKKCAFDEKASGAKWENIRREEEIGCEAFVADGYHAFYFIVELANQENARLLPIIRTLLDVNERLIEQLEYFVARCEQDPIKGMHPDGLIRSRKTYGKFKDAIAFAEEKMKEILG